jgi:hypothetical protein
MMHGNTKLKKIATRVTAFSSRATILRVLSVTNIFIWEF